MSLLKGPASTGPLGVVCCIRALSVVECSEGFDGKSRSVCFLPVQSSFSPHMMGSFLMVICLRLLRFPTIVRPGRGRH